MTAAADVWSLLNRSELLVDSDIERLEALASQQGYHDARDVLQWLVGQSVLTNYQASIITAGRAGPFRFGDYRIVDRLDRAGSPGQFRAIFRAIHAPSGHAVSLDFLADGDVEPTTLARQLAHVERHNRLNHDNLTDTYEFVRLPAYKFEVQEDVGNATLEQRVDAKGPMEPLAALTYLNQMATGLDALARAGLCHGSIRPDTVVGKAGVCRLVRQPLRQFRPLFPFEGVRHTGTRPTLPAAQLECAAPELWEPGVWPNVRSDLYGLGCVFCFMLTGRLPRQVATVSNAQELLRDHATELVADLSGIEGLDPSIAETVLPRLIARDPDDRYDSPERLLDDIARWRGARKSVPLPVTLARYLESLAPFANAPRVVTRAPTSNANVTPTGIPEFHHDFTGTMISRAARSRRRNRWLVPMSCVGLAVLMLLVVRWVWQPVRSPQFAGQDVSVIPEPNTGEQVNDTVHEPRATGSSQPPDSVGDPRYAVMDDDGRLIWARPTNGSSIDFRYAPQGGQFFLAARPQEILLSQEGQRVVQALGPEFVAMRGEWEQKYGIELQFVESMLVSVFPDEQGQPQIITDVTLLNPSEFPAFRRREPTDSNDGAPAIPLLRAGDVAAFRPIDGDGKRLVFGPLSAIREIAKRNDEPVLRREFASLHLWSDRDSHFTIMFAPHYVLRDGRNIVSDAYRQFPMALDEFFGDGIRAILFSATVTDEECFAELRLETTAELRRNVLTSLPRQVEELAGHVESYIVGLSQLDTYWRLLALRYGNMLRFVAGQTRVGVEKKQIVMNVSLPGPAAHNLVLASELALAAGVPGQGGVGEEPAPNLRTIEDVLAQRTSLNIVQQSLEFSVRDLVADVNESVPGLPFPFEVQIVGADLEVEGITRNQQIRGFRGDDETIAGLLTALVMRANPVTTVKNPNELDQKLVWVIEPNPENKKNPIVLITTRQAAMNKGRKLPIVFQKQ